MTENKRRFHRFPFDAHIQLFLDAVPDKPLSGFLQDISLKGALIQVNDTEQQIRQGLKGLLSIRPNQGDIEISLSVEVVFALENKNTYGVNMTSVDIESAGHLRRLVEVNLGDQNSLQRELSNLIHAMEVEHNPE